jgi:hypothetical protein
MLGLVLVVKIVTVLEECNTDEQRFYGQKYSMEMVLIKNITCLRWEVFVA